MATTELRSGATTAAAHPRGRAASDHPGPSHGRDRILSPPSLFSLTPEPPSRPEPPAQATAGEPPLPPLFFGREEREVGKYAQNPLPSILFV